MPVLSDAAKHIEFRYAGTAAGVEAKLATRAGLPFSPIQAGQIRIANPVRLVRNSALLLRGGMQARRLMRSWQPDVVFVTGGYVCAPVVWAASRSNIPILIYLPDVTPGLAVERLAGYATLIAVTFPEVAEFFPDKAIVTGYPIRQELRERAISRTDARIQFDLQVDLPTLFIFGGSRGARSINIAVAAMLAELLQHAQVIHVTGTLDWPVAQKRASALTEAQLQRYRVFPYLADDFITALSAADIVIARAGAATLGEFPALGLPVILVPLPISGGHQFPNAAYLADHNAAVIVDDADMDTLLLPAILELVHDEDRLAAMSVASAALARPDAADRIAQAILHLATERVTMP